MIRIITDSSVLYTEKEAQKAGFDAVPLNVHIGDLEGKDLQMDMDDFYRRIAGGQIPRSSQPSIGEVMDTFSKYPEDEIINISMADGLSGTYQSACSARDMMDHSDKITVFNSRTLCGPHRYMVECAQQMKKAGKSAAEIIQWLEYAADKTESFLIAQDFSFLRRGGRLTPVASAVGSVLRLKPVVRLTDDGMRLDKFMVKRTLTAAMKGIAEHMKFRNVGSKDILYISHAAAPEDAENARQLFGREFPGMEIHVMELSPVFVAQGGPQCIAFQYIEKCSF